MTASAAQVPRCSYCARSGRIVRHTAEDCPRRRHESRPRPRGIDARQLRRLTVVGAEPVDHWRPATRGDCYQVPRPCPYVGCRYHLYLEVSRNGGIRFTHPHLEPDQLTESCTLDVAERGASTYDRIAPLLNVVRERVRQIEARALTRFEAPAKRLLGTE